MILLEYASPRLNQMHYCRMYGMSQVPYMLCSYIYRIIALSLACKPKSLGGYCSRTRINQRSYIICTVLVRSYTIYTQFQATFVGTRILCIDPLYFAFMQIDALSYLTQAHYCLHSYSLTTSFESVSIFHAYFTISLQYCTCNIKVKMVVSCSTSLGFRWPFLFFFSISVSTTSIMFKGAEENPAHFLGWQVS